MRFHAPYAVRDESYHEDPDKDPPMVMGHTVVGSYLVLHLTADFNWLCANCVKDNWASLHDKYDNQWYVIGFDIFEGGYEDYGRLECSHCNTVFFDEEKKE